MDIHPAGCFCENEDAVIDEKIVQFISDAVQAKLAFSPPFSAPKISEALRQEILLYWNLNYGKIQTIKLIREKYGLSLYDAKNAVERIGPWPKTQEL